jgi:hypothetical protein
VADDVVEIKRLADRVVGASPDLTRYHMELRGVGVINIKDLYGVSSIRMTKRVELVVSLERWESGKEYDRLGLHDEQFPILGVDVPLIRMPVAPGRNIAILVEVARRNHLLKERGYDAGPPLRGARGRDGGPGAGHGGRAGGPADLRRRDGRPPAGRGSASWRRAEAVPRGPDPLVSGLSGSGKTHVLRALEDIGWLCVDNLPTVLIPRFADLSRESAGRSARRWWSTSGSATSCGSSRTSTGSCGARSQGEPPLPGGGGDRRWCAASARRAARTPWPSTSPPSRASARSARP